MSAIAHPRLLVSVRSVPEAEAALRGGAELIDVKEPDAGPLGMAQRSMIDAIVNRVGKARPVTAALGELHEHDAADHAITCPVGVTHLKLGLAHAPHHWPDRLDAHLASIGADRFIAVAYADHRRVGAPHVEAVLDWAVVRDVAGILIDTAVKDGRGLRHWCDLPALEHWINAAQSRGQLIALAGSLDLETIETLIPLAPDVIAVRSAACEQRDRRSAVRATHVAHLKSRLTAPQRQETTDAQMETSR